MRASGARSFCSGRQGGAGRKTQTPPCGVGLGGLVEKLVVDIKLQALLENPAPAARADLPGRLTVRRSYDALELVRGTPPVFRPVPLAQTVHFP